MERAKVRAEIKLVQGEWYLGGRDHGLNESDSESGVGTQLVWKHDNDVCFSIWTIDKKLGTYFKFF